MAKLQLQCMFLPLLFATCFILNSVAAQNVLWIQSPRTTNWGLWGDGEMCPDGQYVYGFRLKVQQDMGWILDDTAVNAIELHCDTPNPAAIVDKTKTAARIPTTITSKEGPAGSWGTTFECAPNHFVYRFELRSEAPTADNTAANNLRLVCTDDNVLQGSGLTWGTWTGEINCPRGMWICGLRTQVEDPKPQPADNTGLNNVDFACCDAP